MCPALTWLQSSVALPRRCPRSCPVVVCLSRRVAWATSQRAEADVWGDTHLKALEQQRPDERWLLWRLKEGLSLILPLLLLLFPPPLTLFSGIASLHISTQIALQTESVMVQGVRPESQCRSSHSHSSSLEIFDQTLLYENICQRSSYCDCQSNLTDICTSNPFVIIEERGLNTTGLRPVSFLRARSSQMASCWGACVQVDSAGYIGGCGWWKAGEVTEASPLFVEKRINPVHASCQRTNKYVLEQCLMRPTVMGSSLGKVRGRRRSAQAPSATVGIH